MLRGRIVITAMVALSLAVASLVVLGMVRSNGGPAADPRAQSQRPQIERVGVGVGSALPEPAPEQAEFTVDVPPPVEWLPGGPAPADMFFGDRNIIVSPASRRLSPATARHRTATAWKAARHSARWAG